MVVTRRRILVGAGTFTIGSIAFLTRGSEPVHALDASFVVPDKELDLVEPLERLECIVTASYDLSLTVMPDTADLTLHAAIDGTFEALVSEVLELEERETTGDTTIVGDLLTHPAIDSDQLLPDPGESESVNPTLILELSATYGDEDILQVTEHASPTVTVSRVEADGNGEVSGSGEWDAGF